MSKAFVSYLLLGLTLAQASGCVDVQGGAVELSWDIRRLDGESLASPVCETSGIDTVGLCVRTCDDTGCNGVAECPIRTWACDRFHGITLFEVEEGRKELWIEPRCSNGALANAVIPDPLVRDITKGDVTQLNALLIAVRQDACP
jgi:hypothetical protein